MTVAGGVAGGTTGGCWELELASRSGVGEGNPELDNGRRLIFSGEFKAWAPYIDMGLLFGVEELELS